MEETVMKATLEFDLPEEQLEFMAAVHSMDMFIHLTDLRNHLRTHLKHDSPLNTPEDLKQGIDEILALIQS